MHQKIIQEEHQKREQEMKEALLQKIRKEEEERLQKEEQHKKFVRTCAKMKENFKKIFDQMENVEILTFDELHRASIDKDM